MAHTHTQAIRIRVGKYTERGKGVVDSLPPADGYQKWRRDDFTRMGKKTRRRTLFPIVTSMYKVNHHNHQQA